MYVVSKVSPGGVVFDDDLAHGHGFGSKMADAFALPCEARTSHRYPFAARRECGFGVALLYSIQPNLFAPPYSNRIAQTRPLWQSEDICDMHRE